MVLESYSHARLGKMELGTHTICSWVVLGKSIVYDSIFVSC
jgi:hypothetical protein